MEVHGILVLEDTYTIAYFSKPFSHPDVLLMLLLLFIFQLLLLFFFFFNTDGDADNCFNIIINSKYIFEYKFASYVIFYGFNYHEFDFFVYVPVVL